VAIKIDLHFSATSVEELKEQLKKAYEELGGPAVETPKIKSTKTEYQIELATKTKAAMAKKKKNLKKYTGALFGWNFDEDNNLYPNWEEQDKITLMQEWYKKLTSYAAVAKRAQEAGWKGKKGGKWTTYLVKTTLTNDLHERVVEFERPEAATEKKSVKKAKSPKKGLFAGPCKECGATTTPQWRHKSEPFGPLCNACAMTRKRVAKNSASKPKTKSERRKTRADDISSNIQNLRKKSKKIQTEKTVEVAPVPKVQIEVSEGAFLQWSEGNVSSMILRDKTFLVGSKIVESWFTTINPSENYASWASDNLPTYMTHVKSIFDEFQASYPTIFLIQDAGDNYVLMVNQPKALTVRMLDKVRWV
jgi:hypothetical protein